MKHCKALVHMHPLVPVNRKAIKNDVIIGSCVPRPVMALLPGGSHLQRKLKNIYIYIYRIVLETLHRWMYPPKLFRDCCNQALFQGDEFPPQLLQSSHPKW